MATILCIDDDRRILETNRALLSQKGHTVLIASDGTTGIALARQHGVDLAVLDFNMPVMDGNEVAQVLMKENPKLPVVILTGYPYELHESLKWCADAVLEKGHGPEALLSTLRNWSRRRNRLLVARPERVNGLAHNRPI